MPNNGSESRKRYTLRLLLCLETAEKGEFWKLFCLGGGFALGRLGVGKSCIFISNICFLLSRYFKNSKFSVLRLSQMKHTRDLQIFVLLLSLTTHKKIHSTIIYCPVPKYLFQTLTTNYLCRLWYPLVLMVVWKRSLGALSGKYNFNRGYPR